MFITERVIWQFLTGQTVTGTWLAALDPVFAIFLFMIAFHKVKATKRWLFCKQSESQVLSFLANVALIWYSLDKKR
jgi:hypothetical protein